MPQTWVSVLNWAPPFQTTTGAAYASSTALTDIAPSAGSEGVIQPAFFFNGQLFRFSASGIFSTSGTPNLTLAIYYGTAGTISGGVALTTTGAIATLSGAANNCWQLTAETRVLSIAAGTMSTIGQVSGISAATAVNMMPATSSTGGTATVSTLANTAGSFMLGATWGTNSSSNTITCYQFIVEALTT